MGPRSRGRIILHGATYSVYTRIVRLVLAEKNVAYDLATVDVFDADGPPAAYLKIHPFGRIPTLEHGSLQLYETGAITRYLDAAFPTPPLQPRALKSRARVDQIISILDNYAYRTMVWEIFVERIRAPVHGRLPDEARIAGALLRAKICLKALDRLLGTSRYLVGSRLTLTDLHAAPMFAYFTMTPEGKSLIAEVPALANWWAEISTRASVMATRSPFELNTRIR